MHEHGIARELWETVLAEAQKNNISKITKLTIALGEASGIEKDFLDHSFVDHIFVENEIAKNAVVEYEIMPLAAKCNACSCDIKPSDMSELVCPICKSVNISVISGRETYVKNIEGE
ncbi:MAG: hydrogenase maturation nickel metallochaperone HypA [Endomicrobia bacterium]|nr:hydrogenase maturation nickel metallochaperone HypA [Endomicrobiia bacterium]MCL2507057.1 hydrogenase maturation nickel metallochaperone HypA [Endomicrobiia bacterium]